MIGEGEFVLLEVASGTVVQDETVERTAAYFVDWSGVSVGGVGGLEVLVGSRKGSRTTIV